MAFFAKVLVLAMSLALGASAPQTLIHTGTPLRLIHTGPSLRTFHTVQSTPVIQTLRTIPSHQIQTFHTIPASTTHFTHATPIVQAVRTLNPVVTTIHQAAPATPVAVQAVRSNNNAEKEEEAFDTHPQYNFGYSVSDDVTGDVKTREENRDGDVVTGSYTVNDPDGRIRKVTYTADAEHGFQAVVTYDGEQGPPAIPIETPTNIQTHDDATVITAARTAQPQQLVLLQEQKQATKAETKSSIDNRANAQSAQKSTNFQRIFTAPTTHFIQTSSGPATTLVRLNTLNATPLSFRTIPVATTGSATGSHFLLGNQIVSAVPLGARLIQHI